VGAAFQPRRSRLESRSHKKQNLLADSLTQGLMARINSLKTLLPPRIAAGVTDPIPDVTEPPRRFFKV
jgi:hypothetical protein